MENQKNSNSTLALLVVFIILTVLLGGYIVYDKVLSKNETPENPSTNINTPSQQDNTSTTNTNVKTINDVKGQYTVEFTNLKTEDENFNKASITLNLYDNGVFTYTFSQYAPYGTFGSYYIDGNSIVLTTWFNTNSGTGLNIAKGSKTLTINTDGTISDSNIKVKGLTDNGITSATLTKNNTDISSNEPSNRLSAAFFTESNHTVSEPAM